MTITVTVTDTGRTFSIGENTAEAARQAALASVARAGAELAETNAEAARDSTLAIVNYRPSFAAAIADFAVGEVFTSDASGTLLAYTRTGTTPFYVRAPNLDPISAPALASNASGKGASLVGLERGGDVEDALRDVVSSRQFGITGTGDETAKLITALASMNTNGHRLRIDTPVNVNTNSSILVSGFADIEMGASGIINFTGGTGGFTFDTQPAQITTWSATGLAQYPSGTGAFVTTYTVASTAGIAVGDVLYFKDSVLTAYSGTNAVAEIFRVIGIISNVLYLNGRQLDAPTGGSGTVWKLPNSVCRLDMRISGVATTNRCLVSVHGYVDPLVNVVLEGNSSFGLLLRSVYGGQVKARVRDLVNKLADGKIGYGVSAYGACKGISIEVHASNVRHAYTDSEWDANGTNAGVARDITVTGTAIGCGSAAFDTHQYSDGIRFENIKVWSAANDINQPDAGQAFAVQLRGTNATVDGLETNLARGVNIQVIPNRNTVTVVNNYRQRNKLVSPYSSTNQLVGFQIYKLTGSGTQKLQVRNSSFGFIQYQDAVDFDEYDKCEIDFGKTNQGWPASPLAGGDHVFRDCIIRDPNNMNLAANDKWTMVGGAVENASNARSYNLGASSWLKAIGHGNRSLNGGNVGNSAFATVTGNDATFIYSGLWIDGGRAEASVIPLFVGAFTGVVSKNMETRAPLFGSATVDLASIPAQGTTTFDITVPGVGTGTTWSLNVNAIADIGALTLTPWVVGTNTVRVRVTNPTAAAIDPASTTFTCQARKVA